MSKYLHVFEPVINSNSHLIFTLNDMGLGMCVERTWVCVSVCVRMWEDRGKIRKFDRWVGAERACLFGDWCVVFSVVWAALLYISVRLCACVSSRLHVCVPRYMYPTSSTCFLHGIHLHASGCQTIITQQCQAASLSLPASQGTALFVRSILKKGKGGRVYMKTLDLTLLNVLWESFSF